MSCRVYIVVPQRVNFRRIDLFMKGLATCGITCQWSANIFDVGVGYSVWESVVDSDGSSEFELLLWCQRDKIDPLHELSDSLVSQSVSADKVKVWCVHVVLCTRANLS